MTDRRVLYAAAFLRALATGMLGVLIGIYLAALGYPPAQIGVIVGAGLAGGAAATAVAMFFGDRLGRKRFLIALALLGGIGALAAAALTNVWAVGAAVFVGMLNGMGRDSGAALALEQAGLPATTTDHERTRVMAWYNVLQDAGHAIGSLCAALPVLLRGTLHLDTLASLRVAVAAYAAVMVVTVLLYLLLSPAVETPARAARVKISPESRGIIFRICALFSLDSLGGGFLPTALLSFFFFKRFGVSEGVLGALFFGARTLHAFSHLGAAWLAE
ncbi:MAG TPA: MFS transporter, partial [Candidatus Udaeobacter sp.]|nr:MFS transporter [Candidatus Udaeobacter sp.]